jgi:multidrug efflux pump subunit AcrA (membrane-fusion protein)
MENPQQAIARLLSALEGLSSEERHLISTGEYARATEVQGRERPLVEKIAELLFQPGVAAALPQEIQKRAQALLDTQREVITTLAERVSAARAQLNSLELANVKARRIRPAYGQKAVAAAPLSFVSEA